MEIDLKEEPDFLEKSRFKDGRLDLLRAGDGDEGATEREILGKVKDLRLDKGVAGALTEIGKGIGEVVIVGGSSDGGWLWSAIIGGAKGVSFVAAKTNEGGLEEVDGVTRDSAEEDSGREGLRMSLFSSGNDTSEAEVSSWSEGESADIISGGELMLRNESEAWA